MVSASSCILSVQKPITTERNNLFNKLYCNGSRAYFLCSRKCKSESKRLIRKIYIGKPSCLISCSACLLTYAYNLSLTLKSAHDY